MAARRPERSYAKRRQALQQRAPGGRAKFPDKADFARPGNALQGRASMSATPDALFAYLDRLGIRHSTVHHPPLFTVEQSRALRGKVAGGHTKNLFLRDKKGALYLVIALEDEVIDLKGLHRVLGASGRF